MAGSIHDRYHKIHKLNEFLNSLSRGTMVSLAKIQAKLAPCSKATAERCIKDLRKKFSAPLFYSRKPKSRGYYYKIDDGERFELPGIWFSKAELSALFALESMIHDIPDGMLSGALQQLWNRIEKQCNAMDLPWETLKNKVKILPIAGRRIDELHFKNIIEALMKGRCIEITYKGLGRPETAQRMVSPLKIVRYRDNWYLDAWCHLRNTLILFSINRISASRILEKSAKRISQEKQDQYYAGAYGIFTGNADKMAVVQFNGVAAEAVAQEAWHPRQEQELQPDGSLILKIPYNKDTELIMDLLKWGELAKVLSPKELRDSISEKATRILALYYS